MRGPAKLSEGLRNLGIQGLPDLGIQEFRDLGITQSLNSPILQSPNPSIPESQNFYYTIPSPDVRSVPSAACLLGGLGEFTARLPAFACVDRARAMAGRLLAAVFAGPLRHLSWRWSWSSVGFAGGPPKPVRGLFRRRRKPLPREMQATAGRFTIPVPGDRLA